MFECRTVLGKHCATHRKDPIVFDNFACFFQVLKRKMKPIQITLKVHLDYGSSGDRDGSILDSISDYGFNGTVFIGLERIIVVNQ